MFLHLYLFVPRVAGCGRSRYAAVPGDREQECRVRRQRRTPAVRHHDRDGERSTDAQPTEILPRHDPAVAGVHRKIRRRFRVVVQLSVVQSGVRSRVQIAGDHLQ